MRLIRGGVKWYNDWHYNRNKYNRPVHSVQEARQKNWIELPASKKIYHCMGKGNKNNRKFISPNGMNESVFHPNPDGTYTPVTREFDPAKCKHLIIFHHCGGMELNLFLMCYLIGFGKMPLKTQHLGIKGFLVQVAINVPLVIMVVN